MQEVLILISLTINLYLVLKSLSLTDEMDNLASDYRRFMEWHSSQTSKMFQREISKALTVNKDYVEGQISKHQIAAKVATKTAERAFNLASSANIGVVALQKALATPRLVTREQSKLNQLAKNNVDKLFTTQGSFDWLAPLLGDEELEILEEIERNKVKQDLKK